MSSKVYHFRKRIARGISEFFAMVLTADCIMAAWAVSAASAGAYVPWWMVWTVVIAFAALGAAVTAGAARLTVMIARRLRPGRRLGVIDSYTICQIMANR